MAKQAYYQGRPFWSGSVNLSDGRIEEVHGYAEAACADFHHTLYFSPEQTEKMEAGECAFFFVNEHGSIEGDWRESLSPGLLQRIDEQISFEKPDQTRTVKLAMEKLGLNSRSLNFSEVEVRTDYGYACFLVPGFCDRDVLEESDPYQELMEDAEDTEVNVSVATYSVGTGESESPDENELKLIEQYREEIYEEYGIDQILSDFFSFEYEPEEEY